MLGVVGRAAYARLACWSPFVTTPPPRRSVPPPRAAIAFTRPRKKSLFGVMAVGSFVPGLTKKAFEKYGFSTANLITDWPAIAGQDLAGCTAPERLKWPRSVDRGAHDDSAEVPTDGHAQGQPGGQPQGQPKAHSQGRSPGRSPGGSPARSPGRSHARTERRGRAGATLVLRVDGARALDVQYRSRQIIDRINGYFGYAAVAELRILQAPVAAVERPSPSPSLAAAAQAAHQAAAAAPEIAGIADAGLRNALARLGAGIRTGR
jgi:hypothetical protein